MTNFLQNSIDVPQRQYAILSREMGLDEVVTQNVLFCTAWVGLDEVNRVVFLCHFDTPFSVLSIGKILNEIREIVPEEHFFETKIVNGSILFFPYSILTRLALFFCIKFQSKLACTVSCKRFLYLNLRRKVSVDLVKMKWRFKTYLFEPYQKKKLGWSLLMKRVIVHA
jgi:hypothetical protein